MIVSHNHYDHLCKNTVKRLFKEYSPKFIVPLGLKKILHRWGFCRNVIELDWWSFVTLDSLKFNGCSSPALESKRNFDINKTLWMGMVVESDGKKYFLLGIQGGGPTLSKL